MVDFDGDGDFDLLVGNIAGRVILIPNEGSAKKPAFHRENRRAIQAGGKDLHVEGDAGPVIADWDQDGTPDLLVGAGDGAVHFFRNTGKKDAPVYAAGVPLLPPSKLNYSEPVAQPETPGSRTKVHVTDWDGDGRVDLLVGDLVRAAGGIEADGGAEEAPRRAEGAAGEAHQGVLGPLRANDPMAR